MKVYITNLKTSVERKEHILRELQGKNLDYVFVDCVIGKDLTEAELREKCDMDRINYFNRNTEWFTRGVIGCTLTNQNTYRTLLTSNDKMAMLLEDDTVLPDNLKEILDEIEKKALPGDVILLFYLTHATLKVKPVDDSKVARFFAPLNPECLHGGSAVVVTREAAQKMLNYNTPIKMTPDSWRDFYEAGCIDRLICVYPQPIDTADFGTTMGYVQNNFIRKTMHSNPVTRFLLRLKRKFYKVSKKKVEIVN